MSGADILEMDDFRDDGWAESLGSIERPNQQKAESEWPPAIDLEVLSRTEPAPPKFLISDWLPSGYATMFAGHGGVGKSGIALHLKVCMAAGIPFFGVEVQRTRVLYLSCEDRESVLHWRLSRICAYLGINLASLRGWLNIIDLVGKDAILWENDARNGAAFTASYGRLADRVKDYGAQCVCIDGISDTFGGNENARPDVKRYVNSLVDLIPPDDGAVVLVGHVAKPSSTAGAAGDGYSGSTGWHNSVRARWYLYPETRQGEQRQEKTGELVLDLQKSNLGKTDQSIRFAWDEDAKLFIGKEDVTESRFDQRAIDQRERDGIMAALRSCYASPQKVNVPAASSGQRTAHHVLSARQEFPDSLRGDRSNIRRFWRHIESLRAMGEIIDSTFRAEDRHYTKIIAPKPLQTQDAGNAGNV